MNNLLLKAALTYAQKGLPVFPCKPDKAPYTAHGYKDATTDEQQIQNWWARFPDAMIGVPTGQASGLWVLDLDTPKFEDEMSGFEILQELIAIHGELPPTQIHQTPSGGKHFLFRCPPDGGRVPCRTEVKENVDVRGDGGYIIVPPSITNTGAAYQFLNQCPLTYAPEWLLTLVRQTSKPSTPVDGPLRIDLPSDWQDTFNITHPYAKAALVNECEAVSKAQEGVRNDTLNKASFSLGTFIGSGELEERQVRSKLIESALQCGLSLSEAERTIESGITEGKLQPRTIPAQSTADSQVSEESIASAFTAHYMDTLRFCKELGYWLEWNPQKHIWEPDQTDKVLDYIRKECKVLNPSNKPSIGKSATAKGAERFARADPRHASTADIWDKDSFLLGTPSGVINLKI